MAWTIQDRFPTWGETGESPPDGFFYGGGDQVNEKHLDYLWNSIDALREDTNAALSDLDSDADGVVDETDAVTSGGSLLGDLNATDGETIWDESEGHIPQTRLENTTITVSGGDGLKNGGTTSLGGSVSLDIEPADFAGDGLVDDGSDNVAVNVSDFAGSFLTDDGNNNLAVETSQFSTKYSQVAGYKTFNVGTKNTGRIERYFPDGRTVTLTHFSWYFHNRNKDGSVSVGYIDTNGDRQEIASDGSFSSSWESSDTVDSEPEIQGIYMQHYNNDPDANASVTIGYGRIQYEPA
jgi:hypothetical protein